MSSSTATPTPRAPADSAASPAWTGRARQTLAGQPVRNRAAIVAAGPIANFLLAIVIFTALFMAFGRSSTPPVSAASRPTALPAAAGFQAGDLIKSVNGDPIDSFEDAAAGDAAEHRPADDDSSSSATAQALSHGDAGDRGGRPGRASASGGWAISVSGRRRDPADVQFERCALPTCAVWGGQQIWFIVKTTGAYVVGLFAGRESTDQVSGPIAVAQIAGEMAKISLLELFSLTAVFSVSVGLMNLLPVPLLDGGHLLFYAFEAVRGRPLSERVQEIGLRIGIALVAMLVMFSTSHDIFRIVAGGN